jgi:hypothetical protein
MKIGEQVYVYRKMTQEEKDLYPEFYELDTYLYKTAYITRIVTDINQFITYRLNDNKIKNEFGSGIYYPSFVLKSVRKIKFERIID